MLGERRAAVPQGRQPGADPDGPGGGVARRAAWRRRVALDAGLDLLRVHAHVRGPRAVRRRRRTGLLLWQDMPLQWGYAAGVRRPAVRQAREAVDLLGHHPSIAMWCGHNEPMAIDTAAAANGDPGALRRSASGRSVPAAAHVEQDGARRVDQAGAREGRRDPSGRGPFRRGAASAPARRHRQPPLLRVVLGRRARLARLRPDPAPHGALRERVRRPGRAGGG